MKYLMVAFLALFVADAEASRVILSPPGDGGIIDWAVGKFQIFMDTFTGPGAIVISVISMIIGIALYMTEQRELWVKIVMKIVVVSIFILNIPFWIVLLTFSGT